MHSFVFIAFFLSSFAAAAPATDAVTSLPGFGAPLTPAYSGYLDIPGGKHLHYFLYTSQQSPSTDPVVFWFNGADCRGHWRSESARAEQR
jgi:cathepsin A (carboxypeptidase C)